MTVNRKNDYAFKRIFGHEDSKDVLARFLSIVLNMPIKADELTLIQTELSPDFVADKTAVLDIQVRRSEFHEKMNVEMQQRDKDKGSIDRRILYYWARSFSGELKAGQDYLELPRQISIIIADFDIFDWEDPTKFHGVYHIREQEESSLFSDALEFHILDLPKLRKQPVKEKWSALECWLLYLDNKEGQIMEQVATQEPMIRRAMTIEEAFMKNESERYLYELREKGRRDYESSMITAEKRGRQEGELIGRQEGVVEVTRNLLRLNVPLDQIATATNLTPDEIENLRDTSERF